jgi:hypothetical protein
MPILAIVAFFSPARSFVVTRITGKVTDGTTKNPSAGDDVVRLSWRMARTRTSRTKAIARVSSHSTFPTRTTPDSPESRSVNYFRPAPQGSTTAKVTVYDSAKKVDNLSGEGRIIRLQSAGGLAHVSLFPCTRSALAAFDRNRTSDTGSRPQVLCSKLSKKNSFSCSQSASRGRFHNRSMRPPRAAWVLCSGVI